MDVETCIKNSLETMSIEDIVALSDKLEAVPNDDVADDAQSVWASTRRMCNQLITQRTVATMQEKVVATVCRNNLAVEDRINLIISMMEDCFKEVRDFFCDGPFTMFFKELADEERVRASKIRTHHALGCLVDYGANTNTSFSIEARTSPAGTAIVVHVTSSSVLSACPGNGKKAGKLSITNLKAIVAGATVGVSQANPPTRKEE